MADRFLFSLPADFFLMDSEGILDAGDLPAVQNAPSLRSAIKFADGADESAAVSKPFRWPDGSAGCAAGSGLKLKLRFFGDSAPGANNRIDFEAAIEAVSESDAHDLHATPWAGAAARTVDTTGYATVDPNAGEDCEDEISFTQAQADGVAPGDEVRIALRRDSDDGINDTYADSVWLYEVGVYEVT